VEKYAYVPEENEEVEVVAGNHKGIRGHIKKASDATWRVVSDSGVSYQVDLSQLTPTGGKD
jgi:ribosomal protein L24